MKKSKNTGLVTLKKGKLSEDRLGKEMGTPTISMVEIYIVMEKRQAVQRQSWDGNTRAARASFVCSFVRDTKGLNTVMPYAGKGAPQINATAADRTPH
jgi:hypothetical protein